MSEKRDEGSMFSGTTAPIPLRRKTWCGVGQELYLTAGHWLLTSNRFVAALIRTDMIKGKAFAPVITSPDLCKSCQRSLQAYRNGKKRND